MNGDCTHVRAKHPHGHVTRYRKDGCRCEACTKGHRDYEKRRRLRAMRGQHSLVPADRARAHVERLVTEGLSGRGIARQSGVALLTVQNIMRGKNQRIRATTERAILRLEPAILDHAWVPAVGATRRLQALATLGWSAPMLAPRIGMHPDSVARIASGTPQVKHITDRRIRAMYRDLITQAAPTPDRWARATAARVKAQAARNGWVGPLAWDDIDNDATPADTTPYRPATGPQQARELADMGLNTDQIAMRLGVTRDSVNQYMRRAAA